MNVTQKLTSALHNELKSKESEIRAVYRDFPSQQYERSIPNNIFFEWVGNKNIAERSCRVTEHFRSCAGYNKFNVSVLVDTPYKFIKTESQLDGVTGRVNLITVEQLHKDFLTALRESGVPEYSKLHRNFIQTTQLHSVGLSNQALRSDYYRLALLYTYGGIHSDIAPCLQEFDSASSLHWPLIPLKSKHGLLVQICETHEGGVKLQLATNSLIASDKHNTTILSILKHMLRMESDLKSCNVDTSGEKNGFKKTMYDIMRLPQCEKEHTQEFLLVLKKKKFNTYINNQEPDMSEDRRQFIMNQIKDMHEFNKDAEFALIKECGLPSTVRHIAISKFISAGDFLSGLIGRENNESSNDFVNQLGFPLPQGQPTFGNIKNRDPENVTKWGLGSWYGYKNPTSVDDIDIRM